MDLFEFLMVLVSIIVGLGIAEILTGVARLLRARAEVRYYWVHGVLTVVIFVSMLQQWWEIWGLRDTPSWSFLALLQMLVAPICLFLIAHLMLPDQLRGAELEGYYHGPMRPVWVLGIVAICGSTSFRPLVFGVPLFSPDNLTSFFGLLAFGVLLATSKRSVHAVVVPLVLVGLLWDVLTWTAVIGT
jgi:hypothetical protein